LGGLGLLREAPDLQWLMDPPDPVDKKSDWYFHQSPFSETKPFIIRLS